ncbi:MAG: helix-turn-helix domain-containing protein [Clostridia bacterium]|nr:helix-turn-helix domain-containing protein [Clostridia bacterium]
MNDYFVNGAKASVTIGSIQDLSGNTLLKMWNAEVPAGEFLFQHHNHTCFEITVVDFGSGVYTTNKKSYTMSPGDIFVFSSNEYHCITDVGKNGLKLTNLHFEPRYLWGNPTDSFSEANMNISFSHSENFENRIDFKNAKEIYYYVEKIKNELKEQKSEYQLQVKSLLNLLLINLVRNFRYSDEENSINSLQFKNIQHILNYIDEHFTEKLSLNELAEKAGMSPNYFSSFFKKISGVTLWDYITNKKINLAVQLLRKNGSGMNILEIATLCGFNNTTHFNKMFRRITGMTPTEYKKNTNLMIH